MTTGLYNDDVEAAAGTRHCGGRLRAILLNFSVEGALGELNAVRSNGQGGDGENLEGSHGGGYCYNWRVLVARDVDGGAMWLDRSIFQPARCTISMPLCCDALVEKS